jgi:hypothetical protein
LVRRSQYSEAERDQINARLAKAGSKQNIQLDTGPGLGQSTRLSGRKLLVNGKSVVVEPQIRYPVIQQAVNDDPRPGFYVSATSHVARTDLPEWKQNRYLDGSKIPYGALSGMLRKKGNVAKGDYGLAIRLGDPTGLSKTSGFSFLDAGGEYDYAVGECSYKVFAELGGIGRNNNFANAFIVFPYSKRYDANVKQGIESQLKVLSAADNYDDLPMLMAFCGQAGKGGPGLELWKKYQGLSGPEKVKAPRPANYLNVVNGLRAWGYAGYPGM